MQPTMICLSLILVFVCTVSSSVTPPSRNPQQQRPGSTRPVIMLVGRGAENPLEERLEQLQRRIEAHNDVSDADTEEYFTILGEAMNNYAGGEFLNRIQRRDTALSFHTGEATFTPANPVTIPYVGIMWEGIEHAFNDVMFVGNEENLKRVCRRVIIQFNNLQATTIGFLPNNPNHPDHMALFYRYTYCYQYFAHRPVGNRSGNRAQGRNRGHGSKK